MPIYHPAPPITENQKKIFLKKWEKLLEISPFYTSLPKITIIRCIVPEIQSEAARPIFFCHFGQFLYFQPPNNPENENFLKMKIILWDTLLHMCSINEDHIIYGSWNTRCDRHNFLSLWAIFCPFIPWITQKTKCWKTEKNTWRYYHFIHVPC